MSVGIVTALGIAGVNVGAVWLLLIYVGGLSNDYLLRWGGELQD